MRQLCTTSKSISHLFANHEIGKKLEEISQWLDTHPEVLEWVAIDLGCGELKPTGRHGMSVETVLRTAILKQFWQVSYEELSFHLTDSLSFRAFARIPENVSPRKSALQAAISAISDNTWECINYSILASAAQEQIETARTVRIDSTVTESNIHEPSDSSLLYDSVRVMERLLEEARESWGAPKVPYCNHTKQAKKLAREIQYAKKTTQKEPLYKKLVNATKDNLKSLREAQFNLTTAGTYGDIFEAWNVQVSDSISLIENVISQTERRVWGGEKVPASEKVFSLFEAHTDIIVKSSDKIQYGHKLNLTTGKSGMILDVVIEEGNPADSDQFIPMLERQQEIYGRMPRQVAADGSYACKNNLEKAKLKGVKDVAFHKKRGLSIEDMVKSHWVYRQLRNFRAGIEANISCLKRAYGLSRCIWKGLSHFNAYVWSSVVTYNLSLQARLRAEAA